MSPKRSSIAVVLLLLSSAVIAVPVGLICEYYPDWAAVAVIGPLTLLFVLVFCSTIAIRRRRRAQFAEFGVAIGQRGPAICQASGIAGIGAFASSFDGDIFRAAGAILMAIGVCISAWHFFRAWPEGSHPGDGGEVRGIPPTA